MNEMPVAQVRQLSEWLEGTDITLLELSGPGEVLVRLRRGGAPENAGVAARIRPAELAPPATAAATIVRARSVGTLLLTHPLRTEPLAAVGQDVVAGQPLALLQIGLVLLPVTAPRAGTVSRIVAAHESAVGFGTPLVELA